MSYRPIFALLALSGLLFLSPGTPLSAQEESVPPLPLDPKVPAGRLESGLTYFLRRGEGTPKGRATVLLVSKAPLGDQKVPDIVRFRVDDAPVAAPSAVDSLLGLVRGRVQDPALEAVILVGDIDPDSAEEAVDRAFAGLKGSQKASPKPSITCCASNMPSVFRLYIDFDRALCT